MADITGSTGGIIGSASTNNNPWIGKTVYARGGEANTVDANGFMVDANGNKTYGGDNGGIRTIGSDGTAYSNGTAFGKLDENGHIISLASLPQQQVTPATATAATATSQGYDPKTWALDPSTQTVQGQLNTILNPDSQLMTSARTQAQQQAAGSGLINSSLAASAGEKAMIDSAVPIATSDANMYGANAQFNTGQQNAALQFGANASNQASLANAQMVTQTNTANAQLANQANIANASNALQQRLQQIQSNTQMSIADKQAATSKLTTEMNNASQQAVATLNNDAQAKLAAINNQNKVALQASSAASAYYNQAVQAITNINVSKDLDATTKATMIDNIIAQTNAALKDQTAILGLDIGKNFQAIGTTTGSGDGTAAAKPAAGTGKHATTSDFSFATTGLLNIPGYAEQQRQSLASQYNAYVDAGGGMNPYDWYQSTQNRGGGGDG